MGILRSLEFESTKISKSKKIKILKTKRKRILKIRRKIQKRVNNLTLRNKMNFREVQKTATSTDL